MIGIKMRVGWLRAQRRVAGSKMRRHDEEDVRGIDRMLVS